MFELQEASLGFGRHIILQSVSLRVQKGERVGILGASGAGKSTLLRLAAGLLAPTQGRCINTFRCVRMVFQEPRLLPWRSIAQNIDIPLQAVGLPRAQVRARRDHWLAAVGLADVAQAWPAELSGGMAQRAAIARAFALEPDLLLLDEPFSALDPALRASLGQLCAEHARRTGAALLCVSHHPRELAGLVERCLLVTNGGIQNHTLGDDPAARAATADRLHAQLLAPATHTPLFTTL